MFRRSLKLNKSNSLFLFGARGTGKTTLLDLEFSGKRCHRIDLLKSEEEELFRKNPAELSARSRSGLYDWIVLDEIQKLPSLLDRVHLEIENSDTRFVLSGSSARKLKRGASNLLAGRAFTHHLFPLSAVELGEKFDLADTLAHGSLPKIFAIEDVDSKREYLSNYVSTYLMEEIVAEQIVRKVPPFRDFLKIAAQTNGSILSFSNMANEIGVDDKTVKSYYDILEDTLLGFYLPPFHRSIRKRQRQAPKFYLFDTGVKRAIDRTLRIPLEPRTPAFGDAFEHRVLLEAHWRNSYRKLDFEFSYLRTKDDVEVDLVIERPGEKTVLVEIKSTNNVREEHCRGLAALAEAWPGKGKQVEAQVWSLDPNPKTLRKICRALHWQAGLEEVGLG